MKTRKRFAYILICLLVITVAGCSSSESIPTSMPKSEVELIRSMVESGDDVNVAVGFGGDTPLLAAVRLGEQELAALLIENGADVNFADRHGNTPLHRSIWTSVSLTGLLIDHGADVNAENSLGDTPLHMATRWPYSEQLIVLLIENNANVNAENSLGDTPLHMAAGQVDSEQLIELLIENNANVNARNHEGFTPLHHAVTISLTNTRLLIDYGADVKASADLHDSDSDTSWFPGTSPDTPLDNAVSNHNIQIGQNEWSPLSDGELIEIIRLLIKNGA
jgi:ankyrin repeat protein